MQKSIDKTKRRIYDTCVNASSKEAIMFDQRKFKAQMVMMGISARDIAAALRIDESTFYRKIKANGNFTRSEINTLIEILKINNPEDIFFSKELA